MCRIFDTRTLYRISPHLVRCSVVRRRELAPSGQDLVACRREGDPTQLVLVTRERDGLARRHGIALVNSPGTVDADYRGEIGVLLVNLGEEPVTFSRGGGAFIKTAALPLWRTRS